MNLANKIKDFLKNLLQKVREVYKKLSPDSYEGKYVREMRDSLSELHGKWIQGIKNATENLNNAKTGATKNTAKNDGVRMQYRGINKDGIEVYETSEDTLKLSWVQRKAKYLDIMKNEYANKKAKFVRNGHIYYAEFDKNSLRKPIYGDKRSTVSGTKALIKAGADGDVFNLVENSIYTGSSMNRKNHTSADYFDYFIKTVQIDNKVFDLVADVEKNYGVKDGYVYTLALIDNKNKKASSAHAQTSAVNGAENASNSIVPQGDNTVNNNSMQKDSKNSLRDKVYLKAVKSNNMETAQRMVDEVAEEAGYTIKAYHGTKNFGFTKFDLSKTREAKAIFLADSEDIATSYSGLQGTRDTSDAFTDSLDGMSAQQLVNELNKKEYVTSDTPHIRYFLYNDKMIVRDLFNGYMQTYIDVEQARADLTQKRSKGNYAIYMKPDNMLTIDCNGVEYDEITGWNEENPKQKGTTDDVAQYAY